MLVQRLQDINRRLENDTDLLIEKKEEELENVKKQGVELDDLRKRHRGYRETHKTKKVELIQQKDQMTTVNQEQRTAFGKSVVFSLFCVILTFPSFHRAKHR